MKHLIFLTVTALILGCAPAPKTTNSVNDLADAYVEAFFTAFPEYAPMYGAPDLFPSKLSNAV